MANIPRETVTSEIKMISLNDSKAHINDKKYMTLTETK